MHAQNYDVIIFPAVRLGWVERVVLLLVIRDPLAVPRESDVVLLACLSNDRWLSLITVTLLSGCLTYV